MEDFLQQVLLGAQKSNFEGKTFTIGVYFMDSCLFKEKKDILLCGLLQKP